jgi:transcriptional regulator with XRE-family HTH domain
MPSSESKEKSKKWLQDAMAKNSISTLEDLSNITGIDPGSISRYFSLERRPSIDAIGPLAEALNVTHSDLLNALGATSNIYKIK